MNAQLAMYKGPATGWRNKLGHWAVCFFTASRYGHIELVIDGVCYSASFRDGGVRAKVIADLETSGHWDLFRISADRDLALARFGADGPKPYDWLGMLRVFPLLRWLPRIDGKRFCSEEVAWMLGHADPETLSPAAVLRKYWRPPETTSGTAA
jgi:hypothetical protein